MYRDGLELAASWWNTYAETCTSADFDQWFEDLQTQHVGVEVPRDLLNQYWFERQLGLHHSWQLIMQPAFPGLIVGGKSVRADLLAYIPATSRRGVIVECDGFKYHSGEEAFVRDRKRDRLFHGHGYFVLRFAGKEIYNNPDGVSIELVDALRRVRGKLVPTSVLPGA